MDALGGMLLIFHVIRITRGMGTPTQERAPKFAERFQDAAFERQAQAIRGRNGGLC
jgi:hypothetical protein